MNNKFTTYFLYGIGEIVLVVIGILIAVSIDDWNENRKQTQLDIEFLQRLESELEKDLADLSVMESNLFKAVKYKRVFERFYSGKPVDQDSLASIFAAQYSISPGFVANTATIEELKTSSLRLASSQRLRRQIIDLNMRYLELQNVIRISLDRSQKLLDYVGSKVKKIDQISAKERSILFQDRFFANQIITNYLQTRLETLKEAHESCRITLQQVREKIKTLT
ncbi:MAG: DUF6090 family protein [Cyclobacteriaceae bacterium]